MRNLALLLILPCFACASQPGGAPPDRSSPQATAPSDPQERAAALYGAAWDAFERGRGKDSSEMNEACRLAVRALEALDLETENNVNAPRILLLRHLALFLYNPMGMRADGLGVWERMTRAQRLLARVDPRGSSMASPLYGSSSPSLTSGTLERPADLTVFLPTEPPASGAEDPGSAVASETGPGPSPGGQPTSDATTSTLPGIVELILLEQNANQGSALLDLGLHARAQEVLGQVLQTLEDRGLTESPLGVRTRGLLATSRDRSRQGSSSRAVEGVVASGTLDPAALSRLADLLERRFDEDPSLGGASLPEARDIALASGNLDLAARINEAIYSRVGASESVGAFNASWAAAQIADAGSSRGASLPRFEEADREGRQRFSPADPSLLEVREGHVRAVGDAKGGAAQLELLEAHLADQVGNLRGGHPAVQYNRRVMAAAYAEEGNPQRALALRLENLQDLERTLPDGHPLTLEARLELADHLRSLGETDSALRILQGAESSSVLEGDSRMDPRPEWRAKALELQLACQLPEALELRTRIVQHARDVQQPANPLVEDLRNLAALFRVLGRTEEARRVEREAGVAEGLATDAQAVLARLEAEARARLAKSLAPPKVAVTVTKPRGGPQSLRVDIQDPAGIHKVHFVQDGVPRSLALTDSSWTLDPDGTRGQLEIPVSVPEAQKFTVVSITAENFQQVRSACEAVVVYRE